MTSKEFNYQRWESLLIWACQNVSVNNIGLWPWLFNRKGIAEAKSKLMVLISEGWEFLNENDDDTFDTRRMQVTMRMAEIIWNIT
jgi:hypothetical protein